jgi:hypothetical protein
MTRATGTVVVDVPKETTATKLKAFVKQGMAATPSGRCLTVILPTSSKWAKQLPVEAIVTKSILGGAQDRSPEPEWLFSGNVSVRICKVVRGERSVSEELMLLMFRRSGEMAYRRRATAEADVLEQSTIQVQHPVFTRDVANNVWHVLEQNAKTVVRRRLSTLLTWSDEDTLVITPAGQKSFRHEHEAFDRALIGTPTKRRYDPLTSGQQVLFPL